MHRKLHTSTVISIVTSCAWCPPSQGMVWKGEKSRGVRVVPPGDLQP